MRRKLLLVLILVNTLFAGAILARPASTQMMSKALFDCCKGDDAESEKPYCCFRCCWVISDCVRDKDCQVEVEKGTF